MSPDVPELPSWSKLRIFLWGALWAVLGALAPVAMMLWDWFQRAEAIDWRMISHQAVVMGGLAGIGYWRRHVAWLLQPPVEKAKEAGE